MKYSCEVIADILPLYYDGVCSNETKRVTEEHLAECGNCRAMLKKLSESALDSEIKNERANVVWRHAQAVKHKQFIIGAGIAGVMAIPILVSLIVNLATSQALDWFFIVLASLMVLASVTVVPLMADENRVLWALGAFTASLMMLLYICCQYSKGDWFFVAAIPVLFGLCVVFLPFAMKRLPLGSFVSKHRAIIVMSIDTALLFAVIISSGLYANGSIESYYRPGILITLASLVLPWGLFIIIRYMKADAFVRAGASVIYFGLFTSVINGVINWIIDGVFINRYNSLNLLLWDQNTVEANSCIIFLIACALTGIALIKAGISRGKNYRY